MKQIRCKLNLLVWIKEIPFIRSVWSVTMKLDCKKIRLAVICLAYVSSETLN